MAQDLLLEIGVEELPASFVASAIEALPDLLSGALGGVRIVTGPVHAFGTPRRLAVLAEGVAEVQADLNDQVLGPPARIALDASGAPTRAALSFASKLGVDPSALYPVETEKGQYIAAKRLEKGTETTALLPALLQRVCESIPFRKSMRWSIGEQAFGRPVRWLVSLFGSTPIRFSFAGLSSRPESFGHRFLSPRAVPLKTPSDYLPLLRFAHVLADVAERRTVMLERLTTAAHLAGGELIRDDFLVEENVSLVEEPEVLVGDFDPGFLALPERVILAVAKGHQRYFGVRGRQGQLLPKYLAVVGTAKNPENIRRGNNRVMRARLADAKFFHDEDLKVPLAQRRGELEGILFHKRLGTIGEKVRRLQRLIGQLASQLDLEPTTLSEALEGAALCKCDLVTLMVRELPELQGEIGHAYALEQGIPAGVCAVISEHYQPRGADDPPPPSSAGALVALADRIDTLTGCFAVGLAPTSAADPLALRRAAIGVLRTLMHQQWRLSLARAVRLAHEGFSGVALDLDVDATVEKLSGFLGGRLRGLLSQPSDVVDACIAASADDPYDVLLRAQALAGIDEGVRALVGEVFKRAANIAKDAPSGAPLPPDQVSRDVHPTEQQLFRAFLLLQATLDSAAERRDYAHALGALAEFAPILGRFFEDVFVMVEDRALRENRLRLMRDIHHSCSKLANFNLLAKS